MLGVSLFEGPSVQAIVTFCLGIPDEELVILLPYDPPPHEVAGKNELFPVDLKRSRLPKRGDATLIRRALPLLLQHVTATPMQRNRDCLIALRSDEKEGPRETRGLPCISDQSRKHPDEEQCSDVEHPGNNQRPRWGTHCDDPNIDQNRPDEGNVYSRVTLLSTPMLNGPTDEGEPTQQREDQTEYQKRVLHSLRLTIFSPEGLKRQRKTFQVEKNVIHLYPTY